MTSAKWYPVSDDIKSLVGNKQIRLTKNKNACYMYARDLSEKQKAKRHFSTPEHMLTIMMKLMSEEELSDLLEKCYISIQPKLGDATLKTKKFMILPV